MLALVYPTQIKLNITIFTVKSVSLAIWTLHFCSSLTKIEYQIICEQKNVLFTLISEPSLILFCSGHIDLSDSYSLHWHHAASYTSNVVGYTMLIMF